jgi:proteasome lid subunit RPN8/RPN11
VSATTVPLLRPALADEIEEHAFSESSKEVGGILVGTLTGAGIDLAGAIPALRAEGAAMNVTFTHDVWADVMDTIDDKFPGEQVVGWYHTHPSFGLFLSEYDLFIHRNFFSDSRMMALVIDPIAGELGWFGYQDNDIKEVGRERTRRAPLRHAAASEQARATSRSNLRTLTVAAGCLALVIGVGTYQWGRSTAPDNQALLDRAQQQMALRQGTIDSQRGTIDAQERQIHALQDRLGDQPSAPEPTDGSSSGTAELVTVKGVVQPGDSWWSLAQRYLGDGQRFREIQQANRDIEVLDPSDLVIIPGVPAAE